MPGRGKRLPSIPEEVLVAFDQASKADIAEALITCLAMGHPESAEDAGGNWLRDEFVGAVNAERRARGASLISGQLSSKVKRRLAKLRKEHPPR